MFRSFERIICCVSWRIYATVVGGATPLCAALISIVRVSPTWTPIFTTISHQSRWRRGRAQTHEAPSPSLPTLLLIKYHLTVHACSMHL